MKILRTLFPLLLVGLLSGCGYNDFQRADEKVKAAWSEVVNQYQRRADLIPNLVATVKGYAQQEQDVLVRVTEARARVGQVNVNAGDAQSLAQFQAVQGELSSALARLLVVTENYPNLKSDRGFRDLQVQLESTENRITVARNRYVESVQAYNTLARTFPENLTAKIFGYEIKPNFTVANEAAIAAPPTVDFSRPATPGPSPLPPPQPLPSPSPTPGDRLPVPDPTPTPEPAT